MKRLLVLVVAVGLACGVAYVVLTRPGTESTPEVSATIVTAPPVAAAPAAPAVEPEPAAVPAPAAARPRAAAPKPAASPAEPAAPAVALHIDADVPGAQVFIDRRFIGETPLTTSDVEPGAHTLNLSAKGYDSVAQSITVTPGSQDVVIKFREVRLDAKLEVVHKHRMGSCTGTLIATPQGLRYETSDKDDAFSTSLADLETFEVDYLKKNLRIQPRKGKRFDFSDPAGNADHLFVFHRDVDKARERIKKGDPPASSF